jgi:hypothetical protein
MSAVIVLWLDQKLEASVPQPHETFLAETIWDAMTDFPDEQLLMKSFVAI